MVETKAAVAALKLTRVTAEQNKFMLKQIKLKVKNKEILKNGYGSNFSCI